MSLLLVAALAVGAAAQGSVELDVRGAGPAAAGNVRNTLSIVDAAEREVAAPARIRGLHERAASEIRRALEPYGFYSPTIDGSLAFGPDSSWTARYSVTAGRAIIVARVNLSLAGPGRDAPALQRLIAAFPLAPGDTLLHAPYDRWKLALHVTAADSGYVDAAFDSSVVAVDRSRGTATITLVFDTGPRFSFGPVTLSQDVVDSALLAAIAPDLEGEPYRTQRLIAAGGELAGLPWFSRSYVRPRPDGITGTAIPVEIQLVPAPPRAYDVGGGYSTNTGPRVRARAEFRRLNRRGHGAEVELGASPLERRVGGRYTIPLATRSGTVLSAGAEYVSRDPPTSESDRLVGSLRHARRRGPFLETLGLTAHHEVFEVGGTSGTTNLVRAGASWEIVRLDERLLLAHGWRGGMAVRGAVRGVLADVGFLQIRAGGVAARRLGSRTRLLARVDAGHTITDDFPRLPPSLRFFAGGDETVRGYEYQTLGAHDAEGRVIGGTSLVTAGVEVDRILSGRIGVAAFWDVGGAGRGSSLQLEHGAGLGLEYITPAGTARIYGALALSRPGTPFRIHVLFGPRL